MDQHSTQFQSLTQAFYLLHQGQPQGRVFILNHGFMSNNERMWRRFIHRLPPEANVLAANGPYPIPQKDGEGWKVGYSWFFYDNTTNRYLIDYSICKDFIKNLCQQLGFVDNPKTIIGFSQGGYAAPHMAESLSRVDHVIGIGCRFNIQNPQWPDNLVIEAVHGQEDDVVEWPGAEKSFLALPKSHQGRIKSFKGVAHKPSEEMLDCVAQWAINN